MGWNEEIKKIKINIVHKNIIFHTVFLMLFSQIGASCLHTDCS